MGVATEALRKYVMAHNAGVRTRDFNEVVGLFDEAAELEFKAGPLGTFCTREAIAGAFRRFPPHEEIELLEVHEEGPQCVAIYSCAGRPGIRDGILKLDVAGERIRRLVIEEYAQEK